MEEQNKIAVLNRDVIKYIAMVTMLLNHIATIFLESGALHDAFEFIGYFTAPVMCYFLVEGYHYTRSKKKYGQRLLVFACISQIPYHFAFQFGNLNMIFTLFICFLILVAQEKIANPTLCRIVKVLLMLVTIFSDWSVIAAFCTILLDEEWNDKKKIMRCYGSVYLLFALLNLMNRLGQYGQEQLLQSIGFALLSGVAILCAGFTVCYLYNGKRMEHGKNLSKWFFYIFYPGHLFVFWMIHVL